MSVTDNSPKPEPCSAQVEIPPDRNGSWILHCELLDGHEGPHRRPWRGGVGVLTPDASDILVTWWTRVAVSVREPEEPVGVREDNE